LKLLAATEKNRIRLPFAETCCLGPIFAPESTISTTLLFAARF